MASLHRRKKSSFWACSYFDPSVGKWRLKSTGTADKLEATAICARFAALASNVPKAPGTVNAADAGELIEAGIKLIQTATRGELGEASGRDFVNRVLKASGQTGIEGQTADAFLRNWLSGRELSKAKRTGERYRTVIELFLKHLEKRALVSITAITPRDIEGFRDARRKTVSASTTNEDVKILRAAFTVARKQGVIHSNPAEAVDLPPAEGETRDAFGLGDVKLLLGATKDDEWKVAILLGFYAGLRLGDAVTLKWESVDFSERLIRYKVAKTRKQIETPMHPALQKQLEGMAGDAGGFITPGLAKRRVPGRSGLSRHFMEIMRAAGVDSGQVEGKRRAFSKLSFHSLRHGFVSAMANAGIAPEIRQTLAGHSTADAHGIYTHLEISPLRTAIEKIPSP